MRLKRKRWIICAAALLLIAAASCIIFGTKYTRQECIIQKDRKRIYGQLYLPGRGMGKYPLVILGHGYGGSYSDNLDYGRYLSSHGIACYVFDFCGGSEDSKSSGSMADMNILTEVSDMNDIVDYMLEQNWLDKSRLYLAGKSLGGSVAALTGSERPEDVAGLILHYPFFVVSEAFLPEGEQADGNLRYVIDDVFGKISRFKGSVLIFNGDEDKYVPLEYTQMAAEAYENAELVVLEGSGHGFKGAARDEVKEKMVNFITNSSEE